MEHRILSLKYSSLVMMVVIMQVLLFGLFGQFNETHTVNFQIVDHQRISLTVDGHIQDQQINFVYSQASSNAISQLKKLDFTSTYFVGRAPFEIFQGDFTPNLLRNFPFLKKHILDFLYPFFFFF